MRRWPSLLFMVLMPLAYFLISYATSDSTTMLPFSLDGQTDQLSVLDRDLKAVYLAMLGIGVTASFSAMTVIRPGSAALQRLRLIGYSAWTLLWARLVVLGLVTLVSTAVFSLFFVPLVHLTHPAWTVVSLILVGLTGIALGTLVGLLVPREFEAAMILVALAGLQMALGRGGSETEQYLPYWPSLKALLSSTFGDAVNHGAVLVAVLYMVAGLGIGLALWMWRTRVWRP